MFDLLRSLEFWVAMILAVMLKLRASTRITAFGAIFTVAIAVTSALIFTKPTMLWLQLSDDPLINAAVAALIALSAEHLSRMLLDTKLADLISAWRGK